MFGFETFFIAVLLTCMESGRPVDKNMADPPAPVISCARVAVSASHEPLSPSPVVLVPSVGVAMPRVCVESAVQKNSELSLPDKESV